MTTPRKFPDMWVDPEDAPREEGAVSLGDERATLVEFLRYQRLTMEMKCAGLDAEQLARRSVEPSTMSLLGLVRHMADVERSWFRRVMAGQDAPRHFRSEGDRDGDWNGAVGDPETVAEAWRLWRDEVAFRGRHGDGEISLREVLVHMVEEYARYNGHADLLRERIDGRVGQ